MKIFFATLLGIMHRVARRVSVSFCQLFLKRFSKNMESGLEPTREKNGRSGDRTHAGLPNPCYTACVTGVRMSARPRESAEPLLHSVCNRGSAPKRKPNLCYTAWVTGVRRSARPRDTNTRKSGTYSIIWLLGSNAVIQGSNSGAERSGDSRESSVSVILSPVRSPKVALTNWLTLRLPKFTS